MSTTHMATGADRIDDHETARRTLEVGQTARRLALGGLTVGEASDLTAHLVGLPHVRTGWSIRQVEHLLFLRSIIESGRLEP